MFEYNGVFFTAEQVFQKAQDLGLSVDDYLKQNPEIKENDTYDFLAPAPTVRARFEDTEASLIEQGILIPGEDKSFQKFYSQKI